MLLRRITLRSQAKSATGRGNCSQFFGSRYALPRGNLADSDGLREGALDGDLAYGKLTKGDGINGLPKSGVVGHWGDSE